MLSGMLTGTVGQQQCVGGAASGGWVASAACVLELASPANPPTTCSPIFLVFRTLGFTTVPPMVTCPSATSTTCRQQSTAGEGGQRLGGGLPLRRRHLPRALALSQVQTPLGQRSQGAFPFRGRLACPSLRTHNTVVECTSWSRLRLCDALLRGPTSVSASRRSMPRAKPPDCCSHLARVAAACQERAAWWASIVHRLPLEWGRLLCLAFYET